MHEIEGRPQYFGLIAVQCFAASQMHRDEKNAEDAYKIRLKEVLGLNENFNLQILFHGEDSGVVVQKERVQRTIKKPWANTLKFLQEPNMRPSLCNTPNPRSCLNATPCH